ncbi:MAG: hypothetical protein ACK2U1_20880, partial [Anaerolineales bacterium]
MFRSILWRIATPYIILSLIIMLILGLIVSNIVRQDHIEHLEYSLQTQATLISDSIEYFIETDQLNEKNPDQLAKHWSELTGSRVTLIDKDGMVIGESDDDFTQMDNHINRPEIQEALNKG